MRVYGIAPWDMDRMTGGELEAIARESHLDQEMAHVDADDALLEFIGDEDITRAWNAIEKWYA